MGLREAGRRSVGGIYGWDGARAILNDLGSSKPVNRLEKD
jgi:hypothetical protein